MSNKTYTITGRRLFLSFWKTSRAVMRVDQQSISALGFTSLSDFAVLEVLLHQGPLPVNTIGEKVLLTSGSMTSAVQRLEKQGQVVRVKSEADARVVEVHLTPEGRQKIEGAFTAHAKALDELFGVLDKEEKAHFMKTLKKLRQHAVTQTNKG